MVRKEKVTARELVKLEKQEEKIKETVLKQKVKLTKKKEKQKAQESVAYDRKYVIVLLLLDQYDLNHPFLLVSGLSLSSEK